MNPKGETQKDSPGDVPEPLVREQLTRMLESPIFSRSPRVSRLFQYLVDQALARRKNQLTEREIGQRAYDEPDFNPLESTMVRVAMRNLRDKLREYYEQWPSDPVRISAPKSYALMFAPGPLLQEKNKAVAIVGTWVSTDFKFGADVISATFEFKRYGPLIAGTLLKTQSEKNAVHIRGSIMDVNINGDQIDFTAMMDVWGMHGGSQYPLKFAGSLSGDCLRLAAFWKLGVAEFTATRVSTLPNRPSTERDRKHER